MKKYLIVLFLIFLVPAFAIGQDREAKGEGYLFNGIGKPSGTTAIHFGGGGEADLYKGLGFGIEGGYMGAAKNMSSGFGIISVNGRYAFQGLPDSRLVPYITGGYSLFFRSGTANAVNYGGGIDYWFAEKYGLKLAFRDHIATNCTGSCHAYQFRGGISFR